MRWQWVGDSRILATAGIPAQADRPSDGSQKLSALGVLAVASMENGQANNGIV